MKASDFFCGLSLYLAIGGVIIGGPLLKVEEECPGEQVTMSEYGTSVTLWPAIVGTVVMASLQDHKKSEPTVCEAPKAP